MTYPGSAGEGLSEAEKCSDKWNWQKCTEQLIFDDIDANIPQPFCNTVSGIQIKTKIYKACQVPFFPKDKFLHDMVHFLALHKDYTHRNLFITWFIIAKFWI